MSPREATLKRKRQEVCRQHKMPERLSTSCVSKTRRIALWRPGRPVGPKDRAEQEGGREVFQRGGLETQAHSRGGILGRMGVA